MTTTTDPRLPQSVDDVAELYFSAEADVLYDEVVTEREHALQAAALAAAAGAEDTQIAAALLHDIGHLIQRDNKPLGEDLLVDHRHEEAGANALAALFGYAVSEPVRMHVSAKRWLCSAEPGYFDTLSLASVRSLAVQGGPFTDAERAEFEKHPRWRDAVQLRRWDDEAKVADAPVPRFEAWMPLLEGLRRP